MQGMMIQDFSTAPRANRSSVAPASQESSKQSFGKLLGTESGKTEGAVGSEEAIELAADTPVVVLAADTPVVVLAADTPVVVLAADTPVVELAADTPVVELAADTPVVELAETSQCQCQEMEAAPFFMAALFDQSASFVKPSDNAELVAAAERTQELIGAWLQPEQDKEEALDEIMTAALEVLEQVSEVPQPKADAELLPPVLSDAEVSELRELMAVMLQSGKVPEPFQGHPLVAELQKQVELVQPLTAAKGQAIAQHSSEPATVLAVATETDNQAAGKSAAAELGAGLQESQIARMLNPGHGQQAAKAQAGLAPPAELGTQAEVASLAATEVESDSKLPVESAKLGVASLAGDLPLQQAAQVANTAQRLAPQGEIVAPKMMQLPSGQQLAESQLVDQLVTHLAGSRDGETGRMQLRLQPAELGSVRLDLIIDGDRLRAHLQAQTQQVQEVLERHLPQLREALQQQGLKIDEFRVDVQSDQDRASEQRFAWQQDQHQGNSPRSPWLNDDWPQPEIAIPLQQLLQQEGGGISLRV